MRIERLSADNQRMQGAERRLWYERHSDEHVRECGWLTGTTLSQRGASAPRSAAILGAGACTEVPLEMVARGCDTVTLVDLDAPGMGRARDECPKRLRPRIQFEVADLTGGVSAALRDMLGIQPWRDLRTLGGTALLDAAADCLERVEVADPPDMPGLEPHGFGIVISTLTLTQLFSLPLLDALDILLAYAPDLADRRDSHPRYAAAARDFRRRVTRAHLSLISRLLAPEGAAALITDTRGYLLPPEPARTPQKVVRHSRPSRPARSPGQRTWRSGSRRSSNRARGSGW